MAAISLQVAFEVQWEAEVGGMALKREIAAMVAEQVRA